MADILGLVGSAMDTGAGLLNNKITNAQNVENMYLAGKMNYEYGEQAAGESDKRTRALYNEMYSPDAKRKQLEQAGLSVGLAYGGAGAGGQSSTAGAMGQGSGGQHAAPVQGINTNLGMSLSQIQLNEALAEKARAEAEKTAGAETEMLNQNITESKTRVEKLIQETTNVQLENTNRELQNEYDKIRNKVKGATSAGEIMTILDGAANIKEKNNKLRGEINGLEIENSKKEELISAQINNINANTANLIVNAALTESKKTLTDKEIVNFEVKIQNILADTSLKETKERIQAVEAYATETLGQPIGGAGMIGEIIKMFSIEAGRLERKITGK